MDGLISFDLLPTLEENYIVDDLQVNKYLIGFSEKKKLNGVVYELNIYDNSIVVFENESFYNTYEIFCNIRQGHKVNERDINLLENIFKSFKTELREHAEKTMKWEQKSTIHISI